MPSHVNWHTAYWQRSVSAHSSSRQMAEQAWTSTYKPKQAAWQHRCRVKVTPANACLCWLVCYSLYCYPMPSGCSDGTRPRHSGIGQPEIPKADCCRQTGSCLLDTYLYFPCMRAWHLRWQQSVRLMMNRVLIIVCSAGQARHGLLIVIEGEGAILCHTDSHMLLAVLQAGRRLEVDRQGRNLGPGSSLEDLFHVQMSLHKICQLCQVRLQGLHFMWHVQSQIPLFDGNAVVLPTDRTRHH